MIEMIFTLVFTLHKARDILAVQDYRVRGIVYVDIWVR